MFVILPCMMFFPHIKFQVISCYRIEVILFVCLFNSGFTSLSTVFQSYHDGTCMRQVIVLPHWNAPAAGTWQEHPTQSHYQLTPGRPAIFPSTSTFQCRALARELLVPSFNDFWSVAAGDRTPDLPHRSPTFYHWTTAAG